MIGGLVGSNSDQEIVCWNWRSGRVLARMQLPDEGWSSSFALLTPTSFVVTSATAPTLLDPLTGDLRGPPGLQTPLIQIYTFAADPDRHINPVQPLDFDYMDDTTPRPMLVAQLELPTFDHVQVTPIFIGAFDVRPDPAFPARPGKPFTLDPERGVLVFELQVMKVIGPTQLEQHGYELFVLREMLVDLAKTGEKKLADVRGTDDRYAVWRVEQRLEWEDWYDKARMKELTMRNRNWVSSTFKASSPADPVRSAPALVIASYPSSIPMRRIGTLTKKMVRMSHIERYACWTFHRTMSGSKRTLWITRQRSSSRCMKRAM